MLFENILKIDTKAPLKRGLASHTSCVAALGFGLLRGWGGSVIFTRSKAPAS